MSLKFGTSAVNTVTYNGNDVKRIVFNGSNAWAKPYTLSVSKGTGVASVTVSRTSTLEPTASTGSVSAGSGTIFHGDKLSVSATASDGYLLDDYTTAYTVSGNTSVSVTASPTVIWQTLFSGSVSKTITAAGANSTPFTKTGAWVRNATKIRITGTVKYASGTAQPFSIEDTVTYDSIGDYYSFGIYAYSATSGYYVKLTDLSQSNLTFTAYGLLSKHNPITLNITKIELFAEAIPQLSAPISVSAVWFDSEFCWEIHNPNTVSVIAHLDVYGNNGVLVDSSESECIPNSNIDLYAYVSSSSHDSISAEVYFSADGYSDSEPNYYEI